MKKELLLTLLVFSLAFASDDFNDYADSTLDDIKSEGDDFVDAGTVVSDTVPTFFSSAYSAFNPGNCGDSWATNNPYELISTFIGPSVFMAMIIAFSLASLYIFGVFLQLPNIIAIAKDEGFQLGMTFLRILFLVGIIASVNWWFGVSTAGASDPIYSKNPLMIDAAMAFARKMVVEMVEHFSSLLLYNSVLHTLYSASFSFGYSWPNSFTFSLGPVIKPIVDAVGLSLQFLSLGISEWLVHIITLCFVKRWMWGVFIPLSMLLRVIPPTRGAGEALFAVSFSLAIFYPLTFLLDYEAHKILEPNLSDSRSSVKLFFKESGLFSVLTSVVILMFFMGGVFIPFFLGGAVSLFFELLRNSVYYIVLMSILLPFINIFITLTASREIARVFQVDVNFMSFMKII